MQGTLDSTEHLIKRLTRKLSSSNYEYIYYSIRIFFNLNILIGVVYILLSHAFFSFKLLDSRDIALIGERYLCLGGLIILPGLYEAEYLRGIRDTIKSKAFSFNKSIIIRLIFLIILLYIMVMCVTVPALLQSSSFDFLKMTTGFFITSLFLGSIGLFVSKLTRSLPTGYLLGFSYYLFEMVTKGKYTKELFLFSLIKGEFTIGKILLAGISIILLSISIIIESRLTGNEAA